MCLLRGHPPLYAAKSQSPATGFFLDQDDLSWRCRPYWRAESKFEGGVEVIKGGEGKAVEGGRERKVRILVFAMENVWVKSLFLEESPTLLISASFAVNPHFSSSDG